MANPEEHNTVQDRILAYVEAIGWTVVYREEAEQQSGFDSEVAPADHFSNRYLSFDDQLDAKVGEFNRRYAESAGAFLSQFRHLHIDIYGNREFVEHLRNRGKFLVHDETHELDLILIDGNKAERIARGMVGGAELRPALTPRAN